MYKKYEFFFLLQNKIIAKRSKEIEHILLDPN